MEFFFPLVGFPVYYSVFIYLLCELVVGGGTAQVAFGVGSGCFWIYLWIG
jgi:hypothetical protein